MGGTPFGRANRQRLRRGGDHEKACCSAFCRCSGPGGIRIGSLQGKGGRESQLLRQHHGGGTDHGGVYRRRGSKGRLHANLHLQVSRHRAHRVCCGQAGSRRAPGAVADPSDAEGERGARRIPVPLCCRVPLLGAGRRHHHAVRHRVCRPDLQQGSGQARGRSQTRNGATRSSCRIRPHTPPPSAGWSV